MKKRFPSPPHAPPLPFPNFCRIAAQFISLVRRSSSPSPPAASQSIFRQTLRSVVSQGKRRCQVVSRIFHTFSEAGHPVRQDCPARSLRATPFRICRGCTDRNGSLISKFFLPHTQAALGSPFLTCHIPQTGAHQHQRSVAIRKASHDSRSAANCTVQASQGIVCPHMPPVRRRKIMIEHFRAFYLGKRENARRRQSAANWKCCKCTKRSVRNHPAVPAINQRQGRTG